MGEIVKGKIVGVCDGGYIINIPNVGDFVPLFGNDYDDINSLRPMLLGFLKNGVEIKTMEQSNGRDH